MQLYRYQSASLGRHGAVVILVSAETVVVEVLWLMLRQGVHQYAFHVAFVRQKQPAQTDMGEDHVVNLAGLGEPTWTQ